LKRVLHVLAVLGVAAALLVAAVPPAQAEASRLPEPVVAGYRVAVVVFDPEGAIDPGGLEAGVEARLPGLLEEQGRLRLAYDEVILVEPVVEVDYYFAGAGLAEGLALGLQELYEPLGEPPWAPEGFEPPRGYAWLDVVEAYYVVWEWALRAVEEAGSDPHAYNALTVIIGDLDGVSRVYYREAHYPYVPSGFLRVEGLRAWGGLEAMTFYDLSSVVKPWPSYRVPFDDEAPPASPDTEPPIWLLEDATSYAAGLVADDIAYHVVNLGGWPVPHQRVEAQIIVVDYGDPEAVEEILSQLDPREIERLTLMLAPWLTLHVNVTVWNATPGLKQAYQEAAARGDPAPLPLDPVLAEAKRIAERALGSKPRIGDPSLEASWVFLVLATPGPAHLQWKGEFNFTGVSLGWFGLTTYPGWDNRVLRSGLPATVAHELGHSLGEGHPFQLPNGTIRWLMDQQATIMSYMDYGIVAYGPSYHYSVERLSLYQALNPSPHERDPRSRRPGHPANRRRRIPSSTPNTPSQPSRPNPTRGHNTTDDRNYAHDHATTGADHHYSSPQGHAKRATPGNQSTARDGNRPRTRQRRNTSATSTPHPGQPPLAPGQEPHRASHPRAPARCSGARRPGPCPWLASGTQSPGPGARPPAPPALSRRRPPLGSARAPAPAPGGRPGYRGTRPRPPQTRL